MVMKARWSARKENGHQEQGSSATTEKEENVPLSVPRNKCTHSYSDPALWLEEEESEMLQDTQYGITYLERELHKMKQKKRTYTHFYKEKPRPHTPSPCPAPYFSARYHLEALKSRTANEKTREKVMGAFHAWYRGQLDAMMHYVNHIQTDLDNLASRDLVGMEMRTVRSTTKLINHFYSFQVSQSKLPLNPRYLFLKYARCLLPRVHTQVMHSVFEKMYGLEKASHLIHKEREGKRRAALRETYKLSQCLEEILRDARQALPEGIRTTLLLVYVEQKMQKLLSLLEEAVTTMEDAQEIFDILSWTEDVSWGVTTKGNYSHKILNLLVKDIETVDADFTGYGDSTGATAGDDSVNGGVFQQDSSSEEYEEENERELEEILKDALLSGCESLQVPSVVQYSVEEEDEGAEEEEEEKEIDVLEKRKEEERKIGKEEKEVEEVDDNKEEKGKDGEEVQEEKVGKVDEEEVEGEELEANEEREKGDVKERDKEEQNGKQKDKTDNGKEERTECTRDEQKM